MARMMKSEAKCVGVALEECLPKKGCLEPGIAPRLVDLQDRLSRTVRRLKRISDDLVQPCEDQGEGEECSPEDLIGVVGRLEMLAARLEVVTETIRHNVGSVGPCDQNEKDCDD